MPCTWKWLHLRCTFRRHITPEDSFRRPSDPSRNKNKYERLYRLHWKCTLTSFHNNAFESALQFIDQLHCDVHSCQPVRLKTSYPFARLLLEFGSHRMQIVIRLATMWSHVAFCVVPLWRCAAQCAGLLAGLLFKRLNLFRDWLIDWLIDWLVFYWTQDIDLGRIAHRPWDVSCVDVPYIKHKSVEVI